MRYSVRASHHISPKTVSAARSGFSTTSGTRGSAGASGISGGNWASKICAAREDGSAVATGLSALDSTGLGVLVGGLKRVRAHDGSLDLVCTQERILKIFRITGLTKVFGIHDSVDEAIAARKSEK